MPSVDFQYDSDHSLHMFDGSWVDLPQYRQSQGSDVASILFQFHLDGCNGRGAYVGKQSNSMSAVLPERVELSTSMLLK